MEQEEKQFLTNLKRELSEYVELRMTVWRLHFYEKTARVSSSAASVLLMSFLLLFFLLFLFVSLGFYLSSILGGYAQGFGVVSLFYLVLLVVFMAIRKSVFEKYLANKIVEELTDDEDEI